MKEIKVSSTDGAGTTRPLCNRDKSLSPPHTMHENQLRSIIDLHAKAHTTELLEHI